MCKVENGKLAPLKFNGYCNELNTYDNIKLLNQEKSINDVLLHDGRQEMETTYFLKYYVLELYCDWLRDEPQNVFLLHEKPNMT